MRRGQGASEIPGQNKCRLPHNEIPLCRRFDTQIIGLKPWKGWADAMAKRPALWGKIQYLLTDKCNLHTVT